MNTKAERNFCVIFADVSGSTRLYEKLGDKEALHAVELSLIHISEPTRPY